MKVRGQWNLILGLFFALLVAVFAVANVSSVTVHYLLGVSEIPLIIVIVGSALLGGLVVGMLGIFRQYKLQWQLKKLEKELTQTKSQLSQYQEKDLSPISITESTEQKEDQLAESTRSEETEKKTP
ncbi:lipopolysaccharide assembly LapA domain-containing protein [Ammoniphilus sp. CFH 90114]|uniref:LapA family protein n=1 Tax=Ammoniphilus sp. CFH 90114 TaxID=2493665 RepID=UPI001F0CB98F|nr:lipopolysaccharide assembly protein LapA domain-containing protein [Ammoniphilus sp. CFH 90114]